jgi:type II secretory pathway predicted ATPase ExeA
MCIAESAAYLRHHLKLARRGNTLFADDTVARLHRVANGLPRALNNAAVARAYAQGLLLSRIQADSQQGREPGPLSFQVRSIFPSRFTGLARTCVNCQG